MANMMAKLALDNMLRVSVSAARMYLHKTLVDIVRAYRNATTSSPSPFPTIQAQSQTTGVTLPEELKLLPLFAMALQVRSVSAPAVVTLLWLGSCLYRRTLLSHVHSTPYRCTHACSLRSVVTCGVWCVGLTSLC